MWIVSVYRDLGYSIENYNKYFKDEDKAYDHFDVEIKKEFEFEIAEGFVSDQEIQNIINAGRYRYENDEKQVLIYIEEVDE